VGHVLASGIAVGAFPLIKVRGTIPGATHCCTSTEALAREEKEIEGTAVWQSGW